MIYSDNLIRKQLARTLKKINTMNANDFIIKELYAPSVYLLKSPGKLLRPALVFIGAKIIGEEKQDYTNLASAIELIHVSSLIQDDIIDNSSTRRGIAAVHVKYGSDIAMLTIDALISKAVSFAAAYGKEVMESLSRAALEMCAGELIDAKLASKSTSIKQYLTAAELKSASLIGTSLSIAAIHKKSPLVQRLYRIGLFAGLAFQIRDDVLDFLEGEPDLKGASVIDIIKHDGKRSRPAIKQAVKINNEYIDKALALADTLPKNSGQMLLIKHLKEIRLNQQSF
ncbi:MAG: polyprenyl synthetase family protein [Candidatus Micrarchaeaceae archaeon]